MQPMIIKLMMKMEINKKLMNKKNKKGKKKNNNFSAHNLKYHIQTEVILRMKQKQKLKRPKTANRNLNLLRN